MKSKFKENPKLSKMTLFRFVSNWTETLKELIVNEWQLVLNNKYVNSEEEELYSRIYLII